MPIGGFTVSGITIINIFSITDIISIAIATPNVFDNFFLLFNLRSKLPEQVRESQLLSWTPPPQPLPITSVDYLNNLFFKTYIKKFCVGADLSLIGT